jgi:hypothetical protein
VWASFQRISEETIDRDGIFVKTGEGPIAGWADLWAFEMIAAQ